MKNLIFLPPLDEKNGGLFVLNSWSLDHAVSLRVHNTGQA
jgi:hypothetical protein